MSLDNQPKSPLNMNYLLAETIQPEKKRVHPPKAAHLHRTSPRARFGRLKRRNMKQSGTPSSSISVGAVECCREGLPLPHYSFFFFNDTATTEIYTLSLHDALPISSCCQPCAAARPWPGRSARRSSRSEEHTSELQSRRDLVCRLLLEKKKKTS